MASNKTHGYQPIALPDWQELLYSIADSVEDFKAGRPQKKIALDATSRAGIVRCYIHSLEYSLRQANNAIVYYEKLTENYDKLIAVMEDSRNQAYDIIGVLKNEIGTAKLFRPLRDKVRGKEPQSEKEGSDA